MAIPNRFFDDAHTAQRLAWVRSLQSEPLPSSPVGEAVVGAASWAAIIAFGLFIGVVYADWVSGEYIASDLVATWRGRT